MPLCTRSATSSAPAPPESSDTTMMSAGATGSLTTSAHPAARRTGSRTDGKATMAAAAAATTTRVAAHLGDRRLMLRFISKSHVGTGKARESNRVGDPASGDSEKRLLTYSDRTRHAVEKPRFLAACPDHSRFS